MFSLTLREQFLVVAILAAAVIGAGVRHWRDARREMPAPVNSPIISRNSSDPVATGGQRKP